MSMCRVVPAYGLVAVLGTTLAAVLAAALAAVLADGELPPVLQAETRMTAASPIPSTRRWPPRRVVRPCDGWFIASSSTVRARARLSHYLTEPKVRPVTR